MNSAGRLVCRVLVGAALALAGSVVTIAPSTAANASVGGTVCKLANDGSVYRYAGDSTWTFLGSSMTAIYGGGYGVFGIGSDRLIYGFTGGVHVIGAPAATLAVSNSALYALSPDSKSIWQYSGSDISWTRIAGRASNIYAGGYGLFAIDPVTKNVVQIVNGRSREIGAPVATLAVSNSALYALSPDSKGIWQYSGSGLSWTRIAGRASNIYAGGYGLFAIDPDNKSVVRYINGGWQEIGTPGTSLAVSDSTLYALSPDRTSVLQYSGSGTSWSKIGGPARDIVPCSV